MKHPGSTALALWSLVLKLSLSIKHRHLNNSQTCHVALCCTLLCCPVLNSSLSVQNIIIFRLTHSLLWLLITDFINQHKVLLCWLNVGYAARLIVASWISTTVFCHFIRMLLSSSPFSSVVFSTATVPPTGLGDILKWIQSDPLRSCKRNFFLTRVRVYAIKKSTRQGFRQSRLRVNVA